MNEMDSGSPILDSANSSGDVSATILGDSTPAVEGTESTEQTAQASTEQVESQTQPTSDGGLYPLPDDASDDARGDFNNKLRALNGVPENAEGYGNFGFSEDIKIDTNSEDYRYYTKLFHEIGLNKEQAKKLLDGHIKYAKEAVEFQKRQDNEVITEYRNKVKNDFIRECGGESQFRTYNETAIRGFKAAAQGAKLSEKDMKGIISVMGDDPRFIRIFNAIGKMHREDFLITGTNPKATEKTFEDMFSGMFNK